MGRGQGKTPRGRCCLRGRDGLEGAWGTLQRRGDACPSVIPARGFGFTGTCACIGPAARPVGAGERGRTAWGWRPPLRAGGQHGAWQEPQPGRRGKGKENGAAPSVGAGGGGGGGLAFTWEPAQAAVPCAQARGARRPRGRERSRSRCGCGGAVPGRPAGLGRAGATRCHSQRPAVGVGDELTSRDVT